MSEMNEYIFSRLIETEKKEHAGSFKVLKIYFNQKPIEDKQRILTDSAFGC